MAPDDPGPLVLRKVNLAAHDHSDELVSRGEPLLLDAERILRIFVAGVGADNGGARALEIAEGGAAPGIDQGLDGGVRVLRRMVDLRDVVYRRDAIIKLAQSTEQLADVDVLRTVHRGEPQQNVLEIGEAPAWRARVVVDEHPVSEETAQRGLELVVVRIDEAGHDDGAGGVDRRTAGAQVWSDGENLLAFDQHVGLGEIAEARVHRHHGATANDVAHARRAAVERRGPALRRGGTRREQFETSSGKPSRR